jgi:hypothetical protein
MVVVLAKGWWVGQEFAMAEAWRQLRDAEEGEGSLLKPITRRLLKVVAEDISM